MNKRTSEEFWQSIKDRVNEPGRWKVWQIMGTTFLGKEVIERFLEREENDS